jgi:Skp family chaperone for outer membrane proteins
MRRAAGCLVGALIALSSGVSAQDIPPVVAQETPILVLRQDEVFEGSAFGRAALEQREAASRDLIAENRQIEAALEAEERDLTTRRATLPPAEFRALSEAFNDKVEGIRAAQDAKARSVGRMTDDARARFLQAMVPVLAEIMAERGALVILDQQSVVLSFDRVDITAETIARIDARIGEDEAAPPETPAPAVPETASPGSAASP